MAERCPVNRTPLTSLQFNPQLPPQHVSGGHDGPSQLSPLFIATLGADMSFLYSFEWHEGQTTSSVFSRPRCRMSYIFPHPAHRYS